MSVKSIAKKAFKSKAITEEEYKQLLCVINYYFKSLKPQSKWIITEIRCPNCLEYFQTDCYSSEELKKCPCCGADMRGEENVLYREETCERKTHCTDYEYWHCIGCNGCKRKETNND